MRPVRARTCVCCETVPQEQLGDPTRFLNGREGMEEVRRWRAAHPRAPLASAMCHVPSELMKKEEDIVDSSTDSDNNSDVLDL